MVHQSSKVPHRSLRQPVVAADSVPIAESDAAVSHANLVVLKVREILSEPKPVRRLGSRGVFTHSTTPSLFDLGVIDPKRQRCSTVEKGLM